MTIKLTALEHQTQIAAATVHKGKRPLNLITTAELTALPATRWRIRHVIPETGLMAIYGPSGSGKTFLVLDIAHALRTGRQWFGHRVNPCPVVYLALEGEGGIAKRVRALTAHHQDADLDIRYLVQPFDLLSTSMIRQLSEAIQTAGCAGGLVIIDTLNRAAPGCDENNSEDMGRVISSAKMLQDHLGGLVLLVHHSGKDVSKGMRGHSSLIAALDVAIEVSRNGDSREWKLAKSKDGEDGSPHPFRLEALVVGEDEDGEPISSCVITEESPSAAVQRPKLPQGATQQIVYSALNEMLKNSHEFGKAGAPAQRPCVQLETAIIEASNKLSCRPDQRQFQVRRAITSMQAKSIFQVSEGWIWLV